jgi:virulence-associated protein VagC
MHPMNRDGLKKFVGGKVQLVPVAHRIDQSGRLLEPIDDDWLLESVTDQGARISNPRTGHATTLGFDHIYEFTSNPDRTRGDARFGFLTLKIQITLKGDSLTLRPTPRPGEAVAYVPPAPAADPLQIALLTRLHETPGRPVHPHELAGYSKENVEAVIARCHNAGLIVGRVLMDNGRIAAAAALNITPSGYRWLTQQTGP